ncbi:c-type cytochrome biogenesis protein CcsB [Desulfosporosinus meridiei]|uniref:Cytochrome c-type biogenesis protein CcsB n=1 Tax=Desulfosporosinus meridiei (strain ATCC BAA-275 / DSM 13257 / KCTC 12902 / NCIMB 13706 / S10) TaxID=768704 RepID=J7IN48_DESMD|nr:c-type cytochrome biogenesis protein CcsB [Desulfosporosinus meridiei]AFQ43222.1 cytochrome c-type biogenesis protein CcsB [Desulfosporosinus meridiei DSM 13257]
MNQGLQNLETTSFYIMLMAYTLSMLFYWAWIGTKKDLMGRFATYLTIVGLLANTAAIILRMIIAGRPPLSNSYEFLLTFVWGITSVYLFVEFRYKLKALGAFVMPVCFMILMFIIMSMGAEERIAQSIPPALKSKWITFHVVTAMFSYGAFAISFGLGIMYLLKFSRETNGKTAKSQEAGIISRFPELETIDELSYKVIGFAFPLLTLCIITGAIWANYAWGTYWSWDPKETWSLITWIIYAAYLHARLMYGWKGKRAAWMTIFGFAAVLFTFFGVNYFLPGLHSYAVSQNLIIV